MLLNFLKQKNECHHTKVPVDVDEAYCPDCGALIKNKWFLVRCNCCNIKRTSHFEYNKIKPDTKFCPNCGSNDYYVQELDSIYFTDVHYAVLKKVVIQHKTHTTRQIWIEEENHLLEEKKLIGYAH